MKKLLILALLCSGLWAQTAQAEKMSEAELIEQLQEIFEKRPDLIINVLRNHSELVLDIAQEGSTKKRVRSLEGQWLEDMKTKKDVLTEDRAIWGNPKAPVLIVEFSDFTCPYCAQAADTVKQIAKAYGDKVRVLFKHTPLSASPLAVLASEYVIAAGFQSAEKAQKLHDELFEHRAELTEKEEVYLKVAAAKVGLDVDKLVADSKSARTKNILGGDLMDVQKYGVEGTPYFFVNDIVVRGALPLELFKEAVDMALAAKK